MTVLFRLYLRVIVKPQVKPNQKFTSMRRSLEEEEIDVTNRKWEYFFRYPHISLIVYK